MSRRTPSRARSKSDAAPHGGITDVAAVVTTGPKLPIADFEPPAAAAELPPFEHRPRRRATK